MADRTGNRGGGANQDGGTLVGSFSFADKVVGGFLVTNVEVKRGKKLVGGASVTLVKLGSSPQWERTYSTASNGMVAFPIPCADDEDQIMVTARIIAGGTPIVISEVWRRVSETAKVARFLRVQIEPTDTAGLAFIRFHTMENEHDLVGISDLVKVSCYGKTITGASCGTTDGGAPRNVVILPSNEQGEGCGWVQLMENGEATLTISLSGGRAPLTFKLSRTTKPGNAVTAITATSVVKTSPVTINVSATLTDPAKPGRLKLVSSANIHAVIIGGPDVCSNAPEGTLTVTAQTQTKIRVTLPQGVRSASIYLEAEGNAAVRSQVITVNAQT